MKTKTEKALNHNDFKDIISSEIEDLSCEELCKTTGGRRNHWTLGYGFNSDGSWQFNAGITIYF